MKVKVSQVSIASKSAILTTSDNKTCSVRLVVPNNKGSENDLWVDLRPIKYLLGSNEDHKNWLTIPRKDTVDSGEVIECITSKFPSFISMNNLSDYVSEADYEIAKQIFQKAENKLRELKTAAGYEVK